VSKAFYSRLCFRRTNEFVVFAFALTLFVCAAVEEYASECVSCCVVFVSNRFSSLYKKNKRSKSYVAINPINDMRNLIKYV